MGGESVAVGMPPWNSPAARVHSIPLATAIDEHERRVETPTMGSRHDMERQVCRRTTHSKDARDVNLRLRETDWKLVPTRGPKVAWRDQKRNV
jgi:hypothetical protein